MKESALKKILASGETESIEFKESPGRAFFETISAFANSRGGIVLLGIDKNGKIKGADPSGDFLTNLTNRIVDKLSLYPEIETFDIRGKRVIAVTIERPGYPVSYEGHYYERVGNTTREMSPKKLQAYLLSKSPWDSIAGNFSFYEIDDETVSLFVRLAIDAKRLPDLSLKEKPMEVLKKLEYLVDGKLTNGAILLFGKNPQKYFINHCVRIGRFKTETTIIDDKWARGNLFKQFEETEKILKQSIAVRYEIKEFFRKDIWDYPIEALREAVLNAIIHRDYFDVANFALIKVYDDHIWITNPGGLPEGITLEELSRPHKSRLRNPQIAKAFYLTGLIEQYGSGTVRMIEWMKEAGLPAPEYKEEQGGFSVYFYKDIFTEENLRKMGLNDRQIKAVKYVKEKGRITNKEYQEICEVKKRQASEDLGLLEAKGVLERVGITGKGTHYILKGRQRGEGSNKGALKGRKNYQNAD
jgi:ATP-dependent DNA helicase RecG